MRTSSIMMAVFVLLFVGCAENKADEHSHEHGAAGMEPVTHTIYSDNTELFVEFKSLVVGSTSVFTVHLTILGETFLPVTEGKVTVSLVIGDKGIRNSLDTVSSPGIFSLALKPTTAGLGKLIFDIETKEYKEQIVIENVVVYTDEHSALENQVTAQSEVEITFLKEQAWKVEFANTPVVKRTFYDIIRTNGQILSAPGDEVIITANASGTIMFSSTKNLVGSEISAGSVVFTISGGNISTGTIDANYKEAKANYDKSKLDFERASALVKDKIVSQKEYLQAKVAFENAQTTFNTIAKNYSANGQTIPSPMSGFVKAILVSEGQFVEAGTPLAIVSKNKNLLLQAHLSQRYFNKIPSIYGANFKMAGVDEVFSTEALNGKIISYGRSVSTDSPFIPITFEIDNIGNIIPGSVAEVFLKSDPIPNALIIPKTALMEEQGTYYVFVQIGGESFQKREVKLGGGDSIYVQVLSGISEGERVVTKGAFQIKLSTATGELPAHGHQH